MQDVGVGVEIHVHRILGTPHVAVVLIEAIFRADRLSGVLNYGDAIFFRKKAHRIHFTAETEEMHWNDRANPLARFAHNHLAVVALAFFGEETFERGRREIGSSRIDIDKNRPSRKN